VPDPSKSLPSPSEDGTEASDPVAQRGTCSTLRNLRMELTRARWEHMPPSQPKQRAHSKESCVAFRKILLKSVQQRRTLRTFDGSFLPGLCRVTPLRINLPACKLVVHIERTIGSESAGVRWVCGLCPADPHTISARFHLGLESDGRGDRLSKLGDRSSAAISR